MLRSLCWLLSFFFLTASRELLAQAAPPSSPPQPAVAVELTALNAQQTDNVAALGQVWGLLKYYHPAVAAGKFNWDAEFLRLLPLVLASRSVAERSTILSTWLTTLGPVAKCGACAEPPPYPVRVKPDLSWAADSKRFGPTLQQQLTFLHANPYQGQPYYVSPGNALSPAFLHEEAYADQACPPPGLRLLALVRYWNMIQYYYPYKYAIGEDWATSLTDFLPRFAEATTPLSYRHTALALFARLHDSHATLDPDPVLTAEAGDYLVAAALQFLGSQAVILRVRQDGLVPRPPLEPGDIITQVEGIPVAELVRQRLPLTPGSNPAAQLRMIALYLLRGLTPTVTLQVSRAGKLQTLLVPRFKLGTVPPVRPLAADSMYRFLTPEVGYVDMARITKAKVPVLMRAFQHTKGVIIDLRNYPGEFVSYLLPGYFLSQPTAFTKVSVYDASYPGRFTERPPLMLQPATVTPYPGRVVVLVNELSLSQSEFTALALRATPHCTILGSQTAGADGDIVRLTLPGNLTTRLSGTGIYYPDGRETQRVGIVPDIELRPTLEGVRAGRDELRDRAVELILQGR